MKKIALLASAITLVFAGCQNSTPSNTNAATASWCISGGPIYTAIDSKPKVDVLAVKNGIISYADNVKEGWCETHDCAYLRP